ncbi:NapC/NirT family cytochrome c [Neobacillus notoginsengisoli]|nr:NapC/NirT family cytochrome c [Neobacillus notoginsengisoli]
MEEEKKELPAPPRFRNKIYKIMTLTLLFLALFFSIGFIGLEASSSSEFCSSCHEMKPEYYTWKASSHAEVDCVNCHIEPGVKLAAKNKADLVKKTIYKNINKNDVNVAPIRMTKEIPNSTCEKCHNVQNRNFSVSGDIIIPHDKHSEKDVKCTQCHSGVAHGKIPDREMTFKTDYSKWDKGLGSSAMADLKFTRPDMDTCMECHESRRITTECTACHATGMLPKSHKSSEFKSKTHGKLAKSELSSCNKCHGPMSIEKLEGYEDLSTLDKYLETKQSHKDEHTYAKENTFCVDCHKQRPESHKNSFFPSHGKEAAKNEQTCYTCHDPNRSTGSEENNSVSCISCHSQKHTNNWREGHPISVENLTRPQESCYKCHVKNTCSSCHRTSNRPDL